MIPTEMRRGNYGYNIEDNPFPQAEPSRPAFKMMTKSLKLNDTEIDRIVTNVRRFSGKYDHCVTKAASFTVAYIDHRYNEPRVIFPKKLGYPFGGQCYDLAYHLFFSLTDDDVLLQAFKKKGINFALAQGYGNKHFINISHVYVIMYDSLVRERDILSSAVILDPSYQIIDTFHRNSYKFQTYFPDPSRKKQDFPLGSLEKIHNIKEIQSFDLFAPFTLGLSQDRRYIYRIGIGNDDDQLFVFISVLHENGIDQRVFYMDPHNKSLKHFETNKNNIPLSTSNILEIKTILHLLQRMKFESLPIGFDFYKIV